MAALGPEIFSRGFRFNPSPLEAVSYYLPHLVAGATLHEAVRPVVHHADVYAFEPAELARRFWPLPRTGHRFFFTPYRKGVRVAGLGSWNLQSTTAIKDGAEAKVGEIKKFRYKKRGVFTDWLMDEFSACCLEDAVVGDKQYVFCNIYVSPRAAPDSAAHQESAAFFAPPTAAAMVESTQAAPKRPAPQGAEPPCPKRMRGAVAPMTPPVVQPARCMTSFAPQRPCVPNHGMAPSSTPSVKWPSPGSAVQPPAPPAPTLQPQMPLRLPSVVRTCHTAVQPCMPQRGVAPSSTTLVTRPLPPAPAPTTCHMAGQPDHSPPAPTPLQPRSAPKQQKMPPPTLPEVRAAHMPLAQAPARHCRPQPSVQTKRRILDPFEAAELRVEEAEEERVAAAAATHDLQSTESPGPLEDVDMDEIAKMLELEDTIPACDGSGMTDEEADEFASSLENEIVIVPKEEIQDEIA